jgi:outer membrane protein TolC
MSRKVIVNVAICVFIAATNIVVAQTPTNPDSALLAILNGLKGTPLHLQQSVQYGLKNATSVRQAEAAYLAAKGSQRKESGFFDPQLFFNLNYQDQQQPVASPFLGVSVLSTQQTISRTGLQLNLPIGTELELALSTSRLNTNSKIALLNPEYDVTGAFNIRQPLLGGFTASARKELGTSERKFEAEKARYDQQVLAVSTNVERMYWDLYAAERDYAVQKLTRDRAEAFLKETELRANTGLVGPNQVANARTFFAEQELQLLERDELLERQSDQLASLIGVRPDPGMSYFVSVDEPPHDFPVDSIDQLVEHALKNNLDLQAAQQDVEAARIQSRAAGWEALPSVNLLGSLGGTGLSGAGQQVSFGGTPFSTTYTGTLSDALNQTTKRNFPNWSVGVEVTIPIGFRSGLGEKDRLEAQVLGAEQRYIEQSRALEDRVRSAHRELVHGKERLEASRQGVDAAQEQIRIGMIEFRNGRSTAFELVRLGEDFAVAQQRYSEALIRTAKAAATLRELTSGGYPSTTNH